MADLLSRLLLWSLILTSVFGDGLYRLVTQQHLIILLSDPPRIITAPKDQLVVSGRVATFVCAAIGTPKPQIEWRKNG